ncbi:MAG: NAD(P)-binding domain-containing protein, partial [Lachnospiraceae bacterium]|nr:NAD(P)-binding domain-containing protein [Lachnospiraceae bacterium]
MKKYGFIGAGNMGYPLLMGAAGLVGKENVTFSTPFAEENEKVKARSGIGYSSDTAELAKESENIVICVKPQMIDKVFEDLKKADIAGKTVISIAAGVTCERLHNGIAQEVRIVRIMPNTPAMVGEGMSCICFSDYAGGFNDEQKLAVTNLFGAVGRYEIIPEKLMNA